MGLVEHDPIALVRAALPAGVDENDVVGLLSHALSRLVGLDAGAGAPDIEVARVCMRRARALADLAAADAEAAGLPTFGAPSHNIDLESYPREGIDHGARLVVRDESGVVARLDLGDPAGWADALAELHMAHNLRIPGGLVARRRRRQRIRRELGWAMS